MRRRDLDGRVAEALDLSATIAGRVLDTALELLVDELVRAGRLEWRGLGTFTVRRHPARRIHNPRTGKVIDLPARRSVAFKPSARVKARIAPSRPSRRRPTTISTRRHGRLRRDRARLRPRKGLP